MKAAARRGCFLGCEPGGLSLNCSCFLYYVAPQISLLGAVASPGGPCNPSLDARAGVGHTQTAAGDEGNAVVGHKTVGYNPEKNPLDVGSSPIALFSPPSS